MYGALLTSHGRPHPCVGGNRGWVGGEAGGVGGEKGGGSVIVCKMNKIFLIEKKKRKNLHSLSWPLLFTVITILVRSPEAGSQITWFKHV